MKGGEDAEQENRWMQERRREVVQSSSEGKLDAEE